MKNELIQPIILLVDKKNPAAEVDGIRAVAIASVMAYAADGHRHAAEWAEWMSGAFAKSVRRADRAPFQRLANEHRPDIALIKVGEAQAAAFRPVPADKMPKDLSRLQVAGTQLPTARASKDFTTTHVTVLKGSLGMSTGKAAAQAAHALFLWHIENGFAPQVIDTEIRILEQDAFDALRRRSGATAVIEDAGRTEIEPGTVTAFTICMTR